MSGVYLSLREDGSFHTLIIKKSVGDYVFFVVLGYEGGRTYGEFFSKLKYHEKYGITGVYSLSTGSGEWEQKIRSTKIYKNKKQYDFQREELFEFMDDNDSKVQHEILDEISEFLHWGYDEETDEEYEEPILKKIDLSKFKKLPNSNHYVNEEWDDKFLEITNSDLWSLSLRFPFKKNLYL
ncbi:hypothetical protein N8334_00245 [Flavobacteriaceae bacterium]|nr:hypothetical protein [Flavobacteriaceae bacterium]